MAKSEIKGLNAVITGGSKGIGKAGFEPHGATHTYTIMFCTTNANLAQIFGILRETS